MPTMTKAGYTPPKAAKKKPPKKPRGGRKKNHRKHRRIGAATLVSLAIFLIACALGAGTLYVYSQTAPYADTFLPGTMLLGYPLEGATMEQAQALLDRITAQDFEDFSVEMTWGNQSYILRAQELALCIDEEATLAPLWACGREGGMLSRFVAMLSLRREPMIMRPVVSYDMTAADELLALIEQDIVCEPTQATVAFAPGSASPFTYTAEATGYRLNLTSARAKIEAAASSVTSAVIALEPQEIAPETTLAALQAATVLRSRVVMAIDAQEASVANASQAAAALNGARIEPGETLSFNELVGERTASRGYQHALEPAYGENVSGVGGGVCQVSSALYQLALLGDLLVIERSAAVYPVGYCPMGQEAAVSDQGVDLVIKNPTAYPLFLTARTYETDGGAAVELALIGEPLAARYALSTTVMEETQITEPVYVRDHEGVYAIYDDERVEVGTQKPGYTVLVERIAYYADGSEAARETVTTDEYAAVPPAIYIGVQSR